MENSLKKCYIAIAMLLLHLIGKILLSKIVICFNCVLYTLHKMFPNEIQFLFESSCQDPLFNTKGELANARTHL